ncbi:COG1470 family protein [Streptomyces sp. NPDC001233]
MPSAARALTRHRRPPRGRVPLPARAALPAALCLGAVSCAVLGTAPLAHAAAAAGWSVAPTGDGRPSFYAEGPPGTVLQDTVSVTNPGRAPVVVRLSGTGLRTVFAERAGNGIRVPARTRAEVPFTVTVPAGAAPGDRSGAVVARDARGRTATVPIRLRVGGPALAALTVEHLAVHADRITYELVNRGTTVLVPKLAVRADGVLGRVLDRAPRTLPVHLRPGARLKLTEPWPDRPALDAVDLRLTVTAPGGAHATATASARFIPWPTATGATAALLTATAALLAARHRRGTRPDTPTPEHPTPDGSASGAPTPACSGSDGPTAGASMTGAATKGASADDGGTAVGQVGGSRGVSAGGVRCAAAAADLWPGGVFTEGAVT